MSDNADQKHPSRIGGHVLFLDQCEHCNAEFVFLIQPPHATHADATTHDKEPFSHATLTEIERKGAKSYVPRVHVGLIPCPRCGKYQSYMVKQQRYLSYGMIIAGLGFALFLLTIVTFEITNGLSHGWPEWSQVLFYTSFPVTILAFIVAAIIPYNRNPQRNLKRRGYRSMLKEDYINLIESLGKRQGSKLGSTEPHHE